MTLYFTNISRQLKQIIKTDYPEDLFDAMMGFFEDHNHFPRFLSAEKEEDKIKISFLSTSECFIVQDFSDSDYAELSDCIKDYDVL